MTRTGAFDAVVIWHWLVTPPGAYALVLAPGRVMTRYQYPSLAPSPGQRYQLLLQPVCCNSTGCNSSWYLWPGPLARFPVVSITRERRDERYFSYHRCLAIDGSPTTESINAIKFKNICSHSESNPKPQVLQQEQARRKTRLRKL